MTDWQQQMPHLHHHLEGLERSRRRWRAIALGVLFLLALLLANLVARISWERQMEAEKLRAEVEKLQVEAQKLQAMAQNQREDQLPFIERDKTAESYFNLSGVSAVAYRYGGGLLDCWFEVVTDGKKEIFGRRKGDEWEERDMARVKTKTPTTAGEVNGPVGEVLTLGEAAIKQERVRASSNRRLSTLCQT